MDHSRTGAPDLVHVPENQWRPFVGSDEHQLPSQDAFGWVPGGPRTIPSCALVANGGILKGLGLGEEIDSHSVVMRINEAPTKGYERDVGQRTTMRLATFEHSLFREKADEVVIGAWLNSANHAPLRLSLLPHALRLAPSRPAADQHPGRPPHAGALTPAPSPTPLPHRPPLPQLHERRRPRPRRVREAAPPPPQQQGAHRQPGLPLQRRL